MEYKNKKLEEFERKLKTEKEEELCNILYQKKQK